MCYKYARVFNEELSLPPRSQYFRPPPFLGVNFVPVPPRRVEPNAVVRLPSWVADEFAEGLDLSQPLEDQLPPIHLEPLSVANGVATYVSQGRAYRLPAPSLPLPPRGHGSRGPLSAPGSPPPVGRGRAAGAAALLRLMRHPGRSSD